MHEQHVAGVVRRRVVGAEHGDPGGVTVCRGVEQRAQNGGGAGGDGGGDGAALKAPPGFPKS